MPQTQEKRALPLWALAVVPGVMFTAEHMVGLWPKLAEAGWKITDCTTLKCEAVSDLLKTDGPHLLVNFPRNAEETGMLAAQTDKVLLAVLKTVPTIDPELLKPLDVYGALHSVPRLNVTGSYGDICHHVGRMQRAYDENGTRKEGRTKRAA